VPNDLAEIAKHSVRGSLYLVTGNILATLIQAIGVFVVARLLGPELYGIYTLSLVVPTLLIQVVDLGVNQGLIRYSAYLRANARADEIVPLIRNGLLFKLLTGLGISCFPIFLSDFFSVYAVNRPDASIFIRLASISILLQVVSDASGSIFIGTDHAEYSAAVSNIQATAKTILAIVLVFSGFAVAGALTGFVVGALAAGLSSVAILYIRLYRTLENKKENISFNKSVRCLIGYGFPIYVSMLFFSLISPLQSIILSRFASDIDIGNFKASLNFVSLIGVLTLPIATALFPAFSKFDKGSKEVRDFFALSIKYAAILIIPSTMMVIIFSNEIVQIVYGSQWVSAQAFLSLNVTLYLLIGLGYEIQNSFFKGVGETRIVLEIGLITLSLFAVSSPILTLYFSVQGMIAAILISNLAATIYGAYMAKVKFKVKFNCRKLLLVYTVAIGSSVPALLTLKAMPFPALLRVVIAGFVYLFFYATLLPLLRTINESEMKKAEDIVGRIPLVRAPIKVLLGYERRIAGMTERFR